MPQDDHYPALHATWVAHGAMRYWYCTAGDGTTERLPIVLVHGLGVSSAYWAHVQPLLAVWRTVYAPDLPGFGRTTRPDGFLNTVALAHALAGWMNAVGIARAHLVGHSLGGPVAAEFTACYPERVSRLVLVGATIGARGARAPRQTIGLLRDSVHESPSLFPVIMRDYFRAGIRRVIGTDVLADDDDTIATIARLRVPMLIVRGARDVVVPLSDTQQLLRAAPHASFAHIEGAAHAVHWSRPHALAAHIHTFLASEESPARAEATTARDEARWETVPTTDRRASVQTSPAQRP